MDKGISFLRNKTAQRFCTLFILCAFIPTVALLVLSYNKVVNQLEEQSEIRLKREVKSYGLSLFDRIIRINNELQTIGRDISPDRLANITVSTEHESDLGSLFLSVGMYTSTQELISIYGILDPELLESILTKDIISKQKPFILTSATENPLSRIFFGVNIQQSETESYSIVAEVKPGYLWGIGPEPFLPPMTELSVYDKAGKSIVASNIQFPAQYRDMQEKQIKKDSNTFQFELDGEVYLASTSNLFLDAQFQEVGWIIIISMAKKDIMSAMDSFKRTFPAWILLFLLLILYFSFAFIRKGLEPLEVLKEGTKRIAKKDFSTSIDIKSNDEFQDLGDSFNTMASQLDKQFHTLTVLNEIDRAILSSFNKKEIIATTLQRLKDFFHCDMSILTKNSPSSNDHLKIYMLEQRRINDLRIEFCTLSKEEKNKFFVDYDFLSIETEQEIPSFLRKIDMGACSHYLFLPLSIDNQIDRALVLGWKDGYIHKKDELDQARQIANQLAIALANSNLLENMEKLAIGTIKALARTVDAKSKWTSGHSERVAELAGQTGKAMGLSDKEIETLTRGGLVHDIGKIGVPVAVLDKPGKLTTKEFSEIKRHPEIGAQILEPITAYQSIIPLVAQHHEKYDGTGYPNGLKEDEIHITARITAVADVWDALVSDRPYREGWIQDKAKQLLLDTSGSHFDPDVVNVFLTVVE